LFRGVDVKFGRRLPTCLKNIFGDEILGCALTGRYLKMLFPQYRASEAKALLFTCLYCRNARSTTAGSADHLIEADSSKIPHSSQLGALRLNFKAPQPLSSFLVEVCSYFR
jgi:hypothetical protein